MLAKLFLGLTDYPIFRRIMWKPIYEWLARKFDFNDWHFMNYGYSPFEHEKRLKLNPEDEIHRHAPGDERTERSQELQRAFFGDRLRERRSHLSYPRAGRGPFRVH